MESYIVRIYRREENDPPKIVGIVEEVGNEEKRAFRTFDELRAILDTPRLGFSEEQGFHPGNS